jgi:hypothetical protein
MSFIEYKPNKTGITAMSWQMTIIKLKENEFQISG